MVRHLRSRLFTPGRLPAFRFVGGFSVSTRSQLRFVQRIDSETDEGEIETTERIAQVYRHSEGYPEGVLPDLAELYQLLESTGTVRGPDYAAAQFVFLGKLRSMGLYLDREPERSIQATKPGDLIDSRNFDHLNQPVFLLGHGIENPADGIHGDEEYLYVVEIPWVTSPDESVEWNVKVSGHCGFPRWDGPTERTFERATWEFEGPLSNAVEELRVRSR